MSLSRGLHGQVDRHFSAHEAHEGIKGLGDNRVYERPVAMDLIEGKLDEVVRFLENLPYGPGAGPKRAAQLAEWRRRCFACGDAREQAIAQVRQSVEGMPKALRHEIEALVGNNKVQRARSKLAEIANYRGRADNSLLSRIEARQKEVLLTDAVFSLETGQTERLNARLAEIREACSR